MSLRQAQKPTAIRPPTDATLKRYGLSGLEWMDLLVGQDGRCYVCQRPPKSGRLCIDHEHVRGWKKLPPAERKLFVRGLLCWTCNHYALARGMSIERALRVAEYLKRYEDRRVKITAIN